MYKYRHFDYSSRAFQFTFNLSVICSLSLCLLPIPPDHQLFLPSMRKNIINQPDGTLDGDTVTSHWLVDDMYTFENVGFTKDVGKIKYLICADCEIGPIGWHNLDEKKCFYVALDRVKHV